MANVTVSVTETALNVSTTTSNITVTDSDGGQTFNVATTLSNINVTAPVTSVIVSQSAGVSNAEVRSALSAQDNGGYGSFSYDSVNGIFSYTGIDNTEIWSSLSNTYPILFNSGTIGIDTNALFTGKTTDNLPQGTSNIYFSTSGAAVNTTNLPEGTNLYFTAARARGNVSAADAGGLGSFTYSNTTGVFTYTGPSDSDVRGLVSAANTTTGHGNISYNSANGQFTFSRVTPANILSEVTAGNVKLKQYSETAVDNGNIFGAVTFNLTNGSIHSANVSGNITGISFTGITPGSSATLILKQDVIGSRKLITTGTQWNNWNFLQDYKTLSTYPGNVDILTVIYDGSTYHASLLNMDEVTAITNSQLANSNIIVNGVTIALGSQGNINSFNSSITVNGNVSGNYFIGDGSQLTNVATLTNAQVVSYIATQPLTVGGNLTVNGNINATGNINYQNVTDLYVTDQKITLNSNAATNSNVEIISNRPTATNTMLKWNEQATRWEFTNNGTTYYPIPTSTTDLVEGANLYFSNARVNAFIQDNITTTDIDEGANLYYTVGRANTAIDNRVTKTFVEGLGVSYTSLTDKPIIPTHTSNLVNDSGFITAATANVISVNGETGVVSLNTTDIPEGANLYYTTGRANSAIAAYQGTINTAGNITTSANIEANSVILDKLHYEIAGTPSYGSNVAVDNYGWYDNLGNGRAWFSIAVSGQSGVFTHGERISFSGVTGNGAANLNGQTFYVDAANAAYGNTSYMFCTDAALTTYVTMSGFGIVDGGTLGGSALYDYSAGTGVVWEVKLDASNNLAIEKDGISQTTISTSGLANVNSISTKTGSNLTLATNKEIAITTVQRNGDIANSANIRGEGFAVSQTSSFFDAPFFSYSGAGQLKTYALDASITAGSNVITVTNIYDLQGVSANVSDVAPYYVFTDEPLNPVSTLFPPGTYVTSVSGNNIYMSANSLYTETLYYDNLDPYLSLGGLTAGARDNTTGLLIGLESDYDDGGANARLITFNFTTDLKNYYAYGPNGPITTNFAYSRGTASDYSINTTVLSKHMFARTDFSADQTVGNFRRGLTVGDADLTNRGENDGLQTFGLNIVWDGTANVQQDYGQGVNTGIFPQILMKQYTDGTSQGVLGNTSTSWAGGGPRLMFMGAYGKNTNDPLSTYARANQELGRISWLTTTSATTNPSTIGPPAYISAISLKDQLTGPGDVGLYLVASPTTSSTNTSQVGTGQARALFLGHHKGNTIVSAASRTNGTCGDIMFTPARAASNRGNAAQMAEQVSTNVSGAAQWARIGYDNPSANTGARVEVTNGFNTASARNGNVTLKINRNDNGVGFGSKAWALKLRSGQTDLVLTEDDVVRTTFAGGNITATTFVGNLSGTTATLTGNVNATNYNGNTVILTSPTGSGSYVSNVAIDTNGWFEYHGNGQAFFSIQNSGQSGVFTHGERISFTGVTGNGAANLNNQTFYVDVLGSQSNIYYPFYLDQSLTTSATMSGLGISDGGTNGGSALYDYTPGAVGSTWTIDPNGANLEITNGTATTVIDTAGNLTVPGNINLTGRLLGYDKVYGEFYHNANINPAAADTIYSFPLDTTVISSDVLVNNTSRINIVKPGIFKIFASIQIKNSDNSADHLMRFWLRKNGVDVPASATVITPLKLQEQVVSMHWMVDSDGDDYWEIVYYVNNTGVAFPNYPAITSPVTAPQAPPIIVNVLPVGA